jgi:hypothetical protein
MICFALDKSGKNNVFILNKNKIIVSLSHNLNLFFKQKIFKGTCNYSFYLFKQLFNLKKIFFSKRFLVHYHRILKILIRSKSNYLRHQYSAERLIRRITVVYFSTIECNFERHSLFYTDVSTFVRGSLLISLIKKFIDRHVKPVSRSWIFLTVRSIHYSLPRKYISLKFGTGNLDEAG